MDHWLEALVCFAGAQGDAFELLELAEEILDQMTPFVGFVVDFQLQCPGRVLGNDDPGASFVEFCDQSVAVECLVCDQSTEFDVVDQWRDLDAVIAIARHETKAHKVAQGIRQRQNFGCHATFGTAYGLALSPPFAPWP